MKKRVLCLIVLFIMLASSITGCGKSSIKTDSGNKNDTTKVTDKKEETLSLKITTVNFGEVPTGKKVQNAWEEYCSKVLGKKLNITFEYINASDYKEKLQIMLTSGKLPDVLTLWGLKQADIIQYGESGMFEDLSKHLDQMPNYKAALDSAPSSKSTIFADTGALYALYSGSFNALYASGGYGLGAGTAVRKDLFDKHNIKIPTTIDEIYDAAKALKEIYPDKYPIFSMSDWKEPRGVLSMAYHTSSDRYYNGDKFVFGPFEENYKEVLQHISKWYQEGLINPDLFVQTSDYGNAIMANGDGMILPNSWNGYPGQWEAAYPDQKWILIPEIKSNKYDKPWIFWQDAKDNVGFMPNYGIVVNPNSKVKDDIFKLLDAQLDDEVAAMLNWGIEGDTYTIDANGVKRFTDEARDLKNDMANKYGYGDGKSRSGIFPQYIDQLARVDQAPKQDFYFRGEIIRASVPEFSKEFNNQEEIVPLTTISTTPLSSDEGDEYSEIMTPVQTYQEEQEAKFITGERSFEEWDDFLKELNAMGDIQRAMDIYNAHIVK